MPRDEEIAPRSRPDGLRKMSSTAGMKMKAAGSGLKEEGKFRQRVDNHYKMMAAARSRLGTAGRLQLAAALGVGSVAGVGAVADDDAAPFLPVWLIALFALYIAVVGRLGLGCAEAKDPKLVEKQTASYTKGCLVGMIALLSMGGAAGMEVTQVPGASIALPAATGAMVIVGSLGSALGAMASGALRRAFEAKEKKSSKD